MNKNNQLDQENNSQSVAVKIWERYKITLIASFVCAVIGLILIAVTGNTGTTVRMTIGAMFGYSIGFLLLIPLTALFNRKFN
jgi:integral membrane sensor domain MASE1